MRGLFGEAVALSAQRSLSIGERRWTLEIAPTPLFLTQYRQEAAWYVLLVGVVFASIASSSALVLTGREAALRRTAEERAAALSEVEHLNERIRRETENRFNVIVDNVGESIIVLDASGHIDSFNKAAEQTFGYTAEEALGREVSLLLTERNGDRLAPKLEHLLRKGVAKLGGRPREIIARRKDGQVFAAELTIGEVLAEQRRRYVAIIHDISHRKEIERELRESEQRFRDLAGSASDWFWETDADYNLTFLSERIGTILGIKASVIQGLSYFDLGLDEQPEIARNHRQDIAQRLPFRDLVFHVGASGDAKDSKYVRLSGIPVFDAAGKYQGYRGIGADVTRELAAERRANQAYQQMADAIESVGDAIAVYGADGRLVICNGAYKQVYGDGENPIAAGQTFDEILESCVTRGIFDTSPLSFSEWKEKRMAQHWRADGSPFIVRLQGGRWIQNREFRTQEGGIIGVRSDITESKLREEALENLQRRYELILDSAGEGIIGLDRAGKITFANRTAGQVLGRESAEMVGRSFDQMVLPDADGSAVCRLEETPISVACREGVTRQVGADTFYRRDGISLPVDYLVAPIYEGAATVGAVMVFRDATLRLQSERSLARPAA